MVDHGFNKTTGGIQFQRCNELANKMADGHNNNMDSNAIMQQLLNSMKQQQQQTNSSMLSRGHPSSSSCGSTIATNNFPQKRPADSAFLNPHSTIANAVLGSNFDTKCLKEESRTAGGNQMWNQGQQVTQSGQVDPLLGQLGMTNAANAPINQTPLGVGMMSRNNNNCILPSNLLVGSNGAANAQINNVQLGQYQSHMAMTPHLTNTNKAPALSGIQLKPLKNAFPMPATGKIFAYKRPKLTSYQSLWDRTKPDLRKRVLNVRMERRNVKISTTMSKQKIGNAFAGLRQAQHKPQQQQQQQLLQLFQQKMQPVQSFEQQVQHSGESVQNLDQNQFQSQLQGQQLQQPPPQQQEQQYQQIQQSRPIVSEPVHEDSGVYQV